VFHQGLYYINMKTYLLRNALGILFTCYIFFISTGDTYAQTTRIEAEDPAYRWVEPFGNYTGGWNDPITGIAAMSGGAGAGPSGSNDCTSGSARGRYTTLANLGLPNGTYNFSFVFYDNNTSVNSSDIWTMFGPQTMDVAIPVPIADPGGMIQVNTFNHTGTTSRAAFTLPTYTNITLTQTDAIFVMICAGGSSNDAIWDYMDITPTYPNLNNPVIPSGQVLNINENNCSGATVGTVAASDADMPAALDEHLTYSITGGNTGNVFSIDPATGKLTATGTLDYETKSSYALTIQVSDNGTAARTTTNIVTVNVGNIVDVTNNPPVFNNQSFSVNENSSFGTVAGTVAVSDPDAGQSVHLTITGGDPAHVFMFNGNQLIVNGGLDFETQISYTLTVLAEDNACPTQSKTATITVNVNDVAETPSGLCTSVTPQGNLVTNGDFESGVNASYGGFTFNNSTCAAGPGTWGISLPISCRSSYVPATLNGVAADASGNPNGHYMLIDADDNTSAVWQSQPVSVTAGVTYFFSSWIANINKTYKNPSELNFGFNAGTTYNVGTRTVINPTTLIKADAADHEWTQYYTTWTPTVSQTVILSFINTSDDGSGSGDDMALDNISFSGSCQFIDAFNTSQLPPSITDCAGNAENLNSLVPSASTTFSWTRNGTAVAGATGPALTTGSGAAAYGRYILCYTKSGCSIRDTVDILMCPLPVELVSFEAWKNGGESILKWITASEKNNAYFVVERSSDGIEFTPVGTIGGNGNSGILRTYSFTDEQPLPGDNYYRLKQVDLDGTTSFSKIKIVRQEDLSDVAIYPNPNNGSFTILMTGFEQSYKLCIFDLEGRTIYSCSGSGMRDKIEVNNVGKGIYIARICMDDAVIVKKVLVY
jgi:hypothetical protein